MSRLSESASSKQDRTSEILAQADTSHQLSNPPRYRTDMTPKGITLEALIQSYYRDAVSSVTSQETRIQTGLNPFAEVEGL